MDFDFVKMMHEWGFDIKNYVVYQSITPEQYKEITGEDYTAPEAQAFFILNKKEMWSIAHAFGAILGGMGINHNRHSFYGRCGQPTF